MTETCGATLTYPRQPRMFSQGEPLADLPVFRCEREPHPPGSVHICKGVVWTSAERKVS